MSGAPKVSIIIPVYQVEDYIDKCIESLQKQTLEDLEFIFIDDCGGDGSVAIIEEHGFTDSRIKLIRNECNMGAGKSRNRGIDAAKGEYIAFLDPDDWVDPNFYESLYNRAVSKHYDIVKGKREAVRIAEDGAVRFKASPVNDRMKKRLTQDMPLYSCFTSEHQTGLFSRVMVQENGIYNGSSSHSENSVFLMKATYYAKSFCFNSDVTYYYLQREDSSVHTFDIKKFSGEVSSFREQIDFAKDHLVEDEYFGTWFTNKINFLMRRYRELAKQKELDYYHRQFLEEIQSIVFQLPTPVLEKLAKRSKKNLLLITDDLDTLSFVLSHSTVLDAYRSFVSTRKKVTRYRVRTRKRVEVADFDFSSGGLAMVQNYKGSIVFTDEFVDRYPEFAKDYINSFMKNADQFNCDLSTAPYLVDEHLARMDSGELCWRYVKRFGYISKTTLYHDESGELWMRGEILGSCDVIDTDDFIIHPQETRRIIDGQLLKEYASNLGATGLYSELRNYLDFLFEEFAIEGDSKHVQGAAYDAFPFNCLLTEGHKYKLFDLEFEYKQPLDKGYMIYKIAKAMGPRRGRRVSRELCEHYRLVSQWDHWDDFNLQNWLDTIAIPDDVPNSEENKALFEHYFPV